MSYSSFLAVSFVALVPFAAVAPGAALFSYMLIFSCFIILSITSYQKPSTSSESAPPSHRASFTAGPFKTHSSCGQSGFSPRTHSPCTESGPFPLKIPSITYGQQGQNEDLSVKHESDSIGKISLPRRRTKILTASLRGHLQFGEHRQDADPGYTGFNLE